MGLAELWKCMSMTVSSETRICTQPVTWLILTKVNSTVKTKLHATHLVLSFSLSTIVCRTFSVAAISSESAVGVFSHQLNDFYVPAILLLLTLQCTLQWCSGLDYLGHCKKLLIDLIDWLKPKPKYHKTQQATEILSSLTKLDQEMRLA